ncbi:MAG: GntR family transcriptional regulator [Rhizobiales bacterium]|nr:GntR family transcriptional regulator [Hyphomicrobiales bacterium]MBA69122.1 GntR family transcriptional regulator [Hyphomicrobiales bacterium]
MSDIIGEEPRLAAIGEMAGSLAQRVYLSLREAILTLEYRPGAVIRKSLICQQLGVSRQPVSEAITRLSSEGLVDVIPQSATRVSRFSLADLRESSFLREAVELAAVEKVAEQRSEEQLAQLSRTLRLQELLMADGDSAGFYQTDEDFHALLMELTGFPGVVSTAAAVSTPLKRARLAILPEPGRPAEVIAEHRAIVEAIRNRDVDAARAAMRLHLGQLMSRIEPLERQRPDLFR